MEIINILAWLVCILIIVQVRTTPLPSHNHHVHHRIYVPQKIKTIHHTKIIKVPQHHHYFHEKEKIIQVEAPHHKEDIGTDFKDIHQKLPSLKFPPYSDDSLEDFSEYSGGSHYGGAGHNIFKKHAIPSRSHKRGHVQRKKESDEDEDE